MRYTGAFSGSRSGSSGTHIFHTFTDAETGYKFHFILFFFFLCVLICVRFRRPSLIACRRGRRCRGSVITSFSFEFQNFAHTNCIALLRGVGVGGGEGAHS